MPKKVARVFRLRFSMVLPAGLPAAGLVGACFGGGAGAGESFTDGMDGMDGHGRRGGGRFRRVTAAFGAFMAWSSLLGV